MSENESNGWSKYQMMIIDRLDELRMNQTSLLERMGKMETEIALLKLKGSFWGGVAGLAAYAITLGIQYLQRR